MTIMQHGEHFELRINNVSFTHIHAQEQTKSQFVYEDFKGGVDSSKTGPSEQTAPQQQMTTFDFGAANSSAATAQNAPMASYPTSMMSMSGGAPRQSGKPSVRRVKPKTKHVSTGAPSGWDTVAAAKKEVFQDGDADDEPPATFSRPMPTAAASQPTTFDFNSFGAPAATSSSTQQIAYSSTAY